MPPLSSGKPQAMNVKPPAPVFPWLNQQYTNQIGGAGMAGINQLQNTAMTGNPVDISPLFEAMMGARQRGLAQGRNNILEGLGAAGLRYGSTARDALVDFEAQSMKDSNQTLADLLRQMGEAAQGRSLQASTLLGTMFGNSAMTLAPTQVAAAGGSSGTATGISQGLQTIALLAAMGVV